MKRKTILLIMIALFLLMGGAGCERENATPDNAITEDARIIYDDAIDGCGNTYMIVIGDPNEPSVKWYKPENLQKEFEQKNLRVVVTYSITDKHHSCGFAGERPVIIIHKIKKK